MSSCTRYDNLMWLSYAKGQLDQSLVSEMQSHSQICDDCRKQLDFSQKIAGIIDMTSAAPPESWTEEAAAQFGIAGQTPESTNIFGDLVFDSYLHGKEAVRSRGIQTRHLTFDLQNCEVDIAMEYSGRQLNLLVGHLLSKTAVALARVEECSLELRLSDSSYSTRPNGFGEFSFNVQTQITGEPVELRCMFKGGPCAIVLIPT